MESHLPPEIWEVILNLLPSHYILRAACVCRQWRHLARRLCRHRCQFLPPRLLVELTHECSLAHQTPHFTPKRPPDQALSQPDPAFLLPDQTNISFNPAHRPPTPKPWPSVDIATTSPNANDTVHTNTSVAETTLSATQTTPSATQLTLSTTQITSNPPHFAPTPDTLPDNCRDSSSPTPSSNSNDMEVEADDDGGIDWLEVTRMVIRTRFTTQPDDCSVTRQLTGVTLLASTGSFMVVVEHGEIGGRLLVFGEEGEECHTSFTGTINKVCIMEGGDDNPMLAVCVDKELQFLLVQRHPKPLTPLNVTPYISVDSRISCEGNILVMSQLVDDYHLAIYQAQLVSSTGVALTLLGRITTSSSPLIWDLWNGFVTVLVSGGYVNCYTLCGTLVGESPLYKDLRYPNPTLLSRGLVFASTITSRTLLSYWHMDRDRDYWLVGESVLTGWVQRGAEAVGNTASNAQAKDIAMEVNKEERSSRSHQEVDQDEHPLDLRVKQPICKPPFSSQEPGYSCILTLAKVRVGSAHMQEVTAIHYRRGIVFCGTRLGDMLIYKILAEEMEPSKNRSRDTKHTRGSRSSPSSKDRLSPSSSEGIKFGRMECCSPLLHLSLGQSPVYRLSSYFTAQGIVVAVGDRERNCQMVTVPYTYLT